MRKLVLSAVAAATLGPAVSFAAISVNVAPLSTFGGGDGWLSPGEGGYSFLGTANNERGIAFGNNHVYLVSRSGGNFIRRLDPLSGADLGSPLDTTGVTGGTFAVSSVGVGGDGAIYVANLTTNSSTSPFKIYKWATEATTSPPAVFSGPTLSGARVGDDLAIIGSGSSTRLVAGFNSTPSVAGNNGYAIIDPTAGTSTNVGFVGTPPNAGDFRLGITFTDASHVLGTAGSSLYRYSSFSGSSGTLLGSPAIPDPAGATADRLLAYTVLGGTPVLAIQSTGDSHISLYDVTDPNAPVYLASGNNTTGALTANGNGTGALAWNVIDANTANLYAMSSNQGIQAFIVTVPEPATVALAAVAGLPLLARRRRSR